MRRRVLVRIALIAGLAAGPGAASAAEPAPAPSPEICRADAQRLCADVPVGVRGRVQCLVAHLDALSPACRAELEPVLQPPPADGVGAARGACQADAARLCAGVAPADGAVAHCLRDREAELSAGCRDALRSEGAR